MIIKGEVKCYYCGYISGELVGDPDQPLTKTIFRPTGGRYSPPPGGLRQLRCARCGGPVYLDEVQVVPPKVAEISGFGPSQPKAQPAARGSAPRRAKTSGSHPKP